MDECYNFLFEYTNNCYDDCPSNTFRVFQNRNIYLETVPENYYLDEDDNIYKKCYDTCRKCHKGGNENNNNCDICIDKCTNDNIYISHNLIF